MKLAKVTIHGLKYFNLPGIKEIEINLINPVTILMGSNGSGKTALLKALGTVPASRTDYYPHGWIEHVYVDGNDTVVTKSDFKNKTKPHSFVLNGEELNESGATPIQIELIEKYLGLNQNILPLTYVSKDIVSLGQAQRKEFFTSTSTYDLTYVSEVFKKVTGKLRDIKSQGSLLRGRKEEISSTLLDNETVKKLRDEISAVKDDISYIDKMIYGLTPHVDKLRLELKVLGQDDFDFNLVTKEIRSIYQHLPKYSHLDKENLEHDRGVTTARIDELKRMVDSLHESIRNKSNRLNELDVTLKELDVNSTSKLTEELQAINVILDENKYSDKYPDIRESFIDRITSQVLDRISTLTQALKDSYPRWMLTERKLSRAKEVHASLSKRIAVGQLKLEGLEEKIKTLSNLSLPNASCKMECALKTDHLNTNGNVIERLEKLKHYRESAENLLNTLKFKEGNISSIIEYNEKFHDHLEYLTDEVYKKYIFLEDIFSLDQFLKKLTFDHSSFMPFVVNTVENAKRKRTYLKMEKRKEELDKELKILAAKNQVSREYIVKEYDKLKDDLDKGLLHLYDVESELTRKESRLNLINEIEGFRDLVSSYQKRLDVVTKRKLLEGSIKYYEEVAHVLSKVSGDRYNRLIDLESKIKEHEKKEITLKEITDTLDKIEKDKWKYEVIATAVSPQGIPKKYLVDYLNSCISTVNYLLKSIFTYSLELEKIDLDKDLDFLFKVIKDGELSEEDRSDMRFLSKGQAQIMNLAWNLSGLMRYESLANLPIFMDEIMNGMDAGHSKELLSLIHTLVESGKLSQVIMVDHGSLCLQSFANCDYICLREDNCILPDAPINQHVRIIKR